MYIIIFFYKNSITIMYFFFFFQAEDGIRDRTVTGVQTCALPIFRGAEQRRPVDGLRGVRGLEGPDAARQPVLERQVVGEAPEQRLTEMHVGLDQAGQDDAAAAIADLRTGAGPLPPSLFSLPRCSDVRDAAVMDRHVHPLDSPCPCAVVQQHVAAAEDEVRGVARHGAQVVTRGWAEVVSSGK